MEDAFISVGICICSAPLFFGVMILPMVIISKLVNKVNDPTLGVNGIYFTPKGTHEDNQFVK